MNENLYKGSSLAEHTTISIIPKPIYIEILPLHHPQQWVKDYSQRRGNLEPPIRDFIATVKLYEEHDHQICGSLYTWVQQSTWNLTNDIWYWIGRLEYMKPDRWYHDVGEVY